MEITRRDVARLMAVGLVGAVAPFSAAAQSPRVRLPLQQFVADASKLAALRRGVAAMKQRKPSDPLSWFFQAAIHGVTDQLWTAAAKNDPEVLNVDRAKYWNQCPHTGQNSANFLPWHRGYTYHFEEILRMHTGDDSFALPYWDYSVESQRTFPKEYGVQHLDGNVGNASPDNINPLFHAQRDYFLCGYEHPFTDQLPLTDLSSRAVDAARAMNSPVFFGDIESEGVGGGIADDLSSTRGLLEQSPHDQIHRSVGGHVEGIDDNNNPSVATGGMAVPPTAAFDPIFSVHHSNMDRLWARWSCLPGKSWGKMPAAEWFDEKPWYFFDLQGNPVNRPRRDYFDYRALGVRFADDDPSCTPLQLPAVAAAPALVRSTVRAPAAARAPAAVRAPAPAQVSAARVSSHSVVLDRPISAPVTGVSRVPITPGSAAAGRHRFASVLQAGADPSERVVLTLHDAEVHATGVSGFDVYIVPRGTSASGLSHANAGYLGPVSLFNHLPEGETAIDQSFDATRALRALGARSLDGLELLLVPYALTTPLRATNVPVTVPERRLDVRAVSVTRGAVRAQSTGRHDH
jgi:hypothetical protein